MNMFWRSAYLSECAEPSTHLNQMTISTFFLVCPFCVRMPPLSFWEMDSVHGTSWYAGTSLRTLQMLFFHFLKITEG